MKKTSLLGLGLLAIALSSCVIEIVPSGLTASNFTFISDQQDPAGNYFVCFGKPSLIDVGFNYSGDLAKWQIKYIGKTTGTTASAVFKFGDVGVEKTGNRVVTKTTLVDSASGGSGNTTIFSVPSVGAQSVRPQAIVVSPAVKGAVQVEITIFDSAGNAASGKLTKEITVISNCG